MDLNLLLLLLLCLCCSALADAEDGTFNEESWLRQYGYVPPLDSRDSSSQDLSEAIREMQRSYNLDVTGLLDQQTITAMKRPRCGIPDKTNVGWSDEAFHSAKWDKYNLTYSIENYPPRIPAQVTLKAIRRAFKVWNDVSPFAFEYIPYSLIYDGHKDDADIMISFHAGPHKGHDFKSSELAHANAPPKPGTGRTVYVHFNLDRQWSVANQDVTGSYNVFLVAVHQLGHSLGLAHSKDTSSIMHQQYKWMETDDFQLSADDRQGIQDIYGYVQKPCSCDALTQENAQLLNEISELKKRLTAHILMRERTPTPPPVKSCPDGWKTFGDGCYSRSTGTTSWQEGRDYCQSQGADLVVINSPAEQEFIGRAGTGGSWWYSWIGLKRSGRSSSWTWVDGTPLTTTQYWYSNGFPRNDEDWNCAFYRHPTDAGTWRNEPCSHRRFALCEK